MLTLMFVLACESGMIKLEDSGSDGRYEDTALITVDSYMNTGVVTAYDDDIDTCYVLFNVLYSDTDYTCDDSVWMKRADYTYDASVSVIDGCRFEFEASPTTYGGWSRDEKRLYYNVSTGECTQGIEKATWDNLTGEFLALAVYDEFEVKTHAYIKP